MFFHTLKDEHPGTLSYDVHVVMHRDKPGVSVAHDSSKNYDDLELRSIFLRCRHPYRKSLPSHLYATILVATNQETNHYVRIRNFEAYTWLIWLTNQMSVLWV